jgi:hypothetical protein
LIFMIVHSAQACNAATDAVLALLGAGGFLRFRLAGTLASPGTVVASLPLATPAFGPASQGVAVANAMTADSDAVGNASPVAIAPCCMMCQVIQKAVMLQCSISSVSWR